MNPSVIVTWEDIYDFIKQEKITTVKKIRVHFNLSNNNYYRKLDGLVSHNMIKKDNEIIKIV